MNKILLYVGLFLLSTITSFSQSAIPQGSMRMVRLDVGERTTIIRNFTDNPSVPFTAGRWCNQPSYPNFNIPVIDPNTQDEFDFSVVNLNLPNATNFELGVYRSSGFGNPNNILDYISVGGSNIQPGRSDTAADAGIWPDDGSFVANTTATSILRFVGNGDDFGPTFWRVDNVNPTAKIVWDAFETPDNEVVGTSETFNIPVVNLGNGVLTITAINFSGINPEDYVLDPSVTLPINIPVDGRMDVPVIYTPQASGTREASMDFTSNTFAGPNSVDLGPVEAILCPTTTYIGSGVWDNGDPTIGSTAVIAADYNTGDPGLGSITACQLIINSGTTLTIGDADFVSILNDITINGTLTIANAGSLVQTNTSTRTVNNGSITVEKLAQALDPRDFVILSSPMSAETRSNVYSSADRVFGITSSNFIPNTAVDDAGFSINFIDDDGDYLNSAITNLNVGTGYLVFPQAVTASSPVDFVHTYSQGTLNSGNINVPLTYNGPATENNFNVLGNPYPSAIDTDLFIDRNDAINEVFFWDHLTDPSADVPGFNTLNFTMDDVSIRNSGMGIPSVNGTALSAPGQFMASGQGFGVIGLQSEAGNNTPVVFSNALRTTGNNNAVRSNLGGSANKLWLRMENSTYAIGSTIGISFGIEGGSPQIDSGLDTKRLNTSINLFSTTENGEQLAIQGREAFDDGIEIDLGMASVIPEEELFTISISQLEGIALENTPVFLIDQLLNTITDLKLSDYSFIADEGVQANRFTLVFEETLLSTEDGSLENQVSIFPNPTTDQITLAYTGATPLTQAFISDTNGKIIRALDLSSFNGQQRVDVSTMTQGIYFIQIQSGTGSVVQKLLIQ